MDPDLRFDDRLKTALTGDQVAGASAVVQWRQIVDLLAQHSENFDTEDVASALGKMHDLHRHVSVDERVSAARSLRGRLSSAPLLVYFCADAPPVAAAAIDAAKLPDDIWADLVPRLSTRARGFLRNRRDLGPMTRQALAGYSSADFVLPSSSIEAKQETPSTSDAPTEVKPQVGAKISELVQRIATYQQQRDSGETPQLPLEGGRHLSAQHAVDEFNFETDEMGTIIWVEGVARGAVVGTSIGEPAFDDGPGPDAAGAGAFKQRMPLENSRMRLKGAESIDGDWRINAFPFFDQASGRFKGYRGILRRPHAADEAVAPSQEQGGGEYIQQLIHELRTPLNAVIGFSEIIDQQLFGPVSHDYRSLASNILRDAQRLLSGFDDLDMAARMDAGSYEVDEGTTHPEWLLNRLVSRLQSLTINKEVELNIGKSEPVRSFAVESDTVERIFSRLLSAMIISGEAGEQIDALLRTEIGPVPVNDFIISRPQRVAGLSEAELLDPGYSEDGDLADAPLLGLGFSLRLVRNLANSVSGHLQIHDTNIVLTLPAVTNSDVTIKDYEFE